MNDPAAFARMVPGFDFLQDLARQAGAAVPGMGQWIAPTLDPAEIDKRIQELRTVQFWLEQNARMLGTTIQALEVQRMTLSTLQNMNVSMGELRDALTATPPAAAPAAAPSATSTAASPAAPPPMPEPATPPVQPEAGAPAPPLVDPMQWWGALTRQFTELAAQAARQSPVEAAQAMTGQMMRAGTDEAGQAGRAAGAGARPSSRRQAGAAKAKPARKASTAPAATARKR